MLGDLAKSDQAGRLNPPERGPWIAIACMIVAFVLGFGLGLAVPDGRDKGPVRVSGAGHAVRVELLELDAERELTPEQARAMADALRKYADEADRSTP